MLLFSFLFKKKKLLSPVDDGIQTAVLYQQLIGLRGGCTDAQLTQRLSQIFGIFGGSSLHRYNYDPFVLDYKGRRLWYVNYRGGKIPQLHIYCTGNDYKTVYEIKYTGKSLINLIRWTYKIPY